MEYGDVIFDSSSEQMLSELEKIQIRAAQIVTGAKRLSSNTLLYKETGWTPLLVRRKMHKLVLLHQMINKTAPDYLARLIPKPHSLRITRQSNKLVPQFKCKTESFKRSFLPSSIGAWNTLLDNTIKTTTKPRPFKRLLSNLFERNLNDLQKCWFYLGDRKVQLTLSQMRLNFSNLNDHLFKKKCIDSPMCACQQKNESVFHFFFECHRYNPQRADFYRKTALLSFAFVPSVNTILYGIPGISIDDNLDLLILIRHFEHQSFQLLILT